MYQGAKKRTLVSTKKCTNVQKHVLSISTKKCTNVQKHVLTKDC